MEFDMNILHISQTPLVAAPSKVNQAINQYTSYKSECLILEDYNGNKKNKFINNAILYTDTSKKKIIDLINQTDIIHIHNNINKDFIALLIKHTKNKDIKFIYQTHSYPKEGPLFFDRSLAMPFRFSKKLAVAQYQPRFHLDFVMVPNIILQKPSFKPNYDKKIKIIYSPAQKNSGGRWSTKYSKELNDTLDYFKNSKEVDIVDISGIHPNELYQIRLNTDITIDEISTGGFHQVSFEGLCAGNIVINGADFISREIMKSISKNKEYAPFVYARNRTIKEVLLKLIENREKLNQIKKESYNYFIENLQPEFLVKRYIEVYKKVLNV